MSGQEADQPDAELRALLAACVADADVDGLRLVLADWLDDHSDPFDRGRLVRLSVRFAALGGNEVHDVRLPVLRAELDDWEDQRLRVWLGPEPAGMRVGIDRGLVKVWVRRLPAWADLPEALRQAVRQGWVGLLSIHSADADEAAGLFADWPADLPAFPLSLLPASLAAFDALPSPPAVASLNVSTNVPDGQDDLPLGALARMRGLCRLALGYRPLTADVARTLADLPDLRTLDLTLIPWDEGPPPALAGLDRLRRLRLVWVQRDEHVADVGSLTGLHELEVHASGSPGPTDAAATRLAGLTGLRELRLVGWESLTEKGLGWLPALSGLRSLALDRSRVTDDLWPLVGRLEGLETLSLAGCPRLAGGAGIGWLARLTSLRHLDLSGVGARFRGKGLPLLGEMPALRSLLLTGVSAKDTELASVGRLAGLEYLNLSACASLAEHTLSSLAGLPGLRSLALARCDGLTNAAGTFAARLTGLRELDLSGCRFLGDRFVACLAKLPALETLDLRACRLGPDASRGLAGAGRLRVLDLSGTSGLSVAGATALAGLERLETLLLANTEALPPAGLRALRDAPALRSLDLSACRWVGPDTAAALCGFEGLRSLNLSGCFLSPDDVRALQEALPGTIVRHALAE